MSTDDPKPAARGTRWGCVASIVVGVLGLCFLGVMAPQILGEPPAFHNTVYRNDRMLFHRWQLDGVTYDGAGMAMLVDLHREYVLVVLTEPTRPTSGTSSYRIDGKKYTITIDGAGDFTGVVQGRTIEVVDARTRRRTTTRLSPGEAFEWMAAKRRAETDPRQVDFRAMLEAHQTPIPGPPAKAPTPTPAP